MNPYDVYAQTDSIGPIFSRMIFPLIGLILLILFFLIYRRMRGKMGGSENLKPSGGLDLVGLKKKGLLTPEELERVGQAMMRQMKQRDEAERKKQGWKSAEDLMLDPEVRRLEIMAAARAKAEGKGATTDTAANALAAETIGRPVASNTDNLGAEQLPRAEASDAEPSDEELAQIELPLDVQHLVDSGLLSDDEVRNVKRRLWARQR